jgi:hypothetical protein
MRAPVWHYANMDSQRSPDHTAARTVLQVELGVTDATATT